MASQYCVYINCVNSRLKCPQLAFFRFPAESNRQKVWLNNCGNTTLNELDSKLLQNKLICELHFDLKYLLRGCSQKRLVKHAVPFDSSLEIPCRYTIRTTEDFHVKSVKNVYTNKMVCRDSTQTPLPERNKTEEIQYVTPTRQTCKETEIANANIDKMKLDELTSETSEAKTIHSNGTSTSDLNEIIKEKPIETDKSDEIKNGGEGDEMDLLIEDVNATKEHLHDDDSRHQTGDQANDDCSSSSSHYIPLDEHSDDQSEEWTLRWTDDEKEDDPVKNDTSSPIPSSAAAFSSCASPIGATSAMKISETETFHNEEKEEKMLEDLPVRNKIDTDTLSIESNLNEIVDKTNDNSSSSTLNTNEQQKKEDSDSDYNLVKLFTEMGANSICNDKKNKITVTELNAEIEELVKLDKRDDETIPSISDKTEAADSSNKSDLSEKKTEENQSEETVENQLEETDKEQSKTDENKSEKSLNNLEEEESKTESIKNASETDENQSTVVEVDNNQSTPMEIVLDESDISKKPDSENDSNKLEASSDKLINDLIELTESNDNELLLPNGDDQNDKDELSLEISDDSNESKIKETSSDSEKTTVDQSESERKDEEFKIISKSNDDDNVNKSLDSNELTDKNDSEMTESNCTEIEKTKVAAAEKILNKPENLFDEIDDVLMTEPSEKSVKEIIINLDEEQNDTKNESKKDIDIIKGEATKDKKEIELNGIFEQYKKDSIDYSAQKPSNKISLKRNLEDTDNEDETPDVKKSNISLKRNIEDDDDKPDEKDSKKPKIKLNESEKPKAKEEFFSLQLFRDFMEKNEIKILSRADLEAFALQKMCEVFDQKSRCAELVRIVKKQQQAVDSLRQKYASADKQIRDMNIVLNRLMAELRNGTAKDVQPVKITRSVGLQVCVTPVVVRNIKPIGSDLTPQSNFQQSPAQLQQQQQPTQRRRILRNNSMNRQQTTPPATRPGPASSKLQPQQQRGAGIKTILPKTPESKTSSSTNGQILGNYLQQRSPTTPSPQAATRKPITPQPQQQQPVATPINNTVEKVIDLTDEDDRPATTNNTPSTTATTTNETTNNLNSSTTNTLSVMLPKQQSGAVVTSSLPRLTYLVSSTPGQQVGQPVLLATTSAPTRPGQARNTLMFKPVPAGQVPAVQRLNIVRPAGTVIPQQQQSIIRAQQPQASVRFASPRVPLGALTAQNQRRQHHYHPAPLPAPPAIQQSQPHWKAMPPKPNLKITQVGDGIVLSWKMLNRDMSQYEEIASYQLYAYQETNAAPSTDMWRKVGDVKALALPMACTLTQFTDGNKYHFAVRAVDVKTRVGPFSPPEHISLQARQN